MGKAEQREKRRAEKLARFEKEKATLVAKIAFELTPRVSASSHPEPEQHPRVAPTARLDPSKQPKAVASGSRFPARVTWCLTRVDHAGEWSWKERRAWTEEEWVADIEPSFVHFGEMTWADVDRPASGEGHKLHHAQEFDRIVVEAQERWMELDLAEFADSVFRFRLGNTRRAWGFIVQAHFHFVWYERHHKIHRYE